MLTMNRLCALMIALPFVLLAGCSSSSDNPIGGACEFTEISGTATITSITAAADSGSNGCGNDAQVVAFTFSAAEDAGADDEVTDMGTLQFILDGGSPADLPLGCLEGSGITVGATFSATKTIPTKGTCLPTRFSVNVDLSTCVAECN